MDKRTTDILILIITLIACIAGWLAVPQIQRLLGQSSKSSDTTLQATTIPTQVLPPTYTPYPTYTLYPTIEVVASTAVVKVVTVTPLPTAEVIAPIPIPTLLRDTTPGTVLEVGQTWKQNEAGLTLLEVKLHPGREDFYGQVYTNWNFVNNSSHELVLNITYNNFSAQDNVGNRLKIIRFYNESFWTNGFSVLVKPRDIFDFSEPGTWSYSLPIVANISNPQLSEIIVTASGISSIDNARWRIPIYH